MRFSEIKKILEDFESDYLVCYIDNKDSISIVNRDEYFLIKNFYNSFPDAYESENDALQDIAEYLCTNYDINYLLENATIYNNNLVSLLNERLDEE